VVCRMLFALIASIPASRTILGPGTAANNAGIDGVPVSHRQAPAA